MSGKIMTVEAIMQRVEWRLHNQVNYEKIMSLKTYPEVEPFNKQKELRLIENFHNCHSGKEIWILGNGPSLDDFPRNFFNDKISIALNYALIEFPRSTYWRADLPALMFWRHYRPEVFRKTFSAFPHSCKIPEVSEQALQALLGKYYFDLIRVKSGGKTGWERFKKLATNAVEASVYDQSPFLAVYFGMSLCKVILIAAYLGAKQITLIGCEHKSKGDRRHAKRGHLADFYYYERYNINRKLGDYKRTTRFLANVLSQHGIEMRRYFYDTGYEEI